MAPPRTVPQMRCPAHPDARVEGFGTRELKGGPVRRYRCHPPGDPRPTPHVFSVPLDADGEPRARGWSPPPACPQHAESHVIRDGTYGIRTPVPRQRYRCSPADGSKPHGFTPALPRNHVHAHEGGCAECEEMRGVHRGETAIARLHSWPTRLVARALNELALGGTYSDVSRQALVSAERIALRHMALVRAGLTATQADAVVDAEETAADAGRPAPAVAEVVAEQAASDTPAPADLVRYRRRRRTREQIERDEAAKAARAAKVAAEQGAAPSIEVPPTQPAPPPPPAKAAGGSDQPAVEAVKRKNPRSAESHNVWHVSADWCEAFGPVVYDPVEARLRSHARAERARLDRLRAAGEPLVRPQVLLLDDMPVYGSEVGGGGRGRTRRDEGFFLLVAAEVSWHDGVLHEDGTRSLERRLKLRLVRAMPKSNAAGWRLLLDELGYAPDFVVADAGTGIGRAVEAHYDPARTTFVPSLWHVGTAVRNGLRDTPGALVKVPGGGREPLRPLRKHLGELSRAGAIADTRSWTSWWDQLEEICVAQAIPTDRIRKRRANYEQPFATAIAALANHPGVPVSTGGLETVMAKRIEPMLAMRCTGFGNIERTNRLFDLAVAREHGAFDDLSDVVTLLRQDAQTADGYTVPLRSISDPRPRKGRYSSLRDSLLISELAEARGLS